MLEKLANVFRVPDLRKRILFTLGLLAVYRLGGHIPTPGINADKLAQFFDQNRGSFLGFVDLFSGGQLRRLTVFALGIMPYITASIILQLMTVVYEPLAKLQKEGELGRKKITQWTRYLTLGLSAVQSLGIAYTLQRQPDFVVNPGIGFVLMTMLTLTTGSVFIMWLGEQITERGIGIGMSLLIFAGIVVGLPRGVMDLAQKVQTQAWGAFTVPAMLMLVVFYLHRFCRSRRKIPITNAEVLGLCAAGTVDVLHAARRSFPHGHGQRWPAADCGSGSDPWVVDSEISQQVDFKFLRPFRHGSFFLGALGLRLGREGTLRRAQERECSRPR